MAPEQAEMKGNEFFKFGKNINEHFVLTLCSLLLFAVFFPENFLNISFIIERCNIQTYEHNVRTG